ncbi:putative sarcosine oxidase [Exophiala viscosa]|uniref:putative sarcosine oxidase n=1 Tax=Exophiala viscosa TaxID=2486360 RepID=UPI0021987516|nr:putative sarcosine oxidase [Exophiala viscosa]
MVKVSHDEKILVVGAGAFGLSTALALRQRGFTNITIIDRYYPPVRDGSSNDISPIIRSDYNDPFYARLAKEAIALWNGKRPSSRKTKDVLRSQSQTFREFSSTEKIRRTIPGLKDLQDPLNGYFNPSSGWADAAGAIKAVADRLSDLGVSFITGPRGTMHSLIIDSKSQVTGVNVVSGDPLRASKVILATGAWTNRYLDLEYTIVGSAQPVGFIQLTPDEAQRLADNPVAINMTSAVFFFPPSPDNILKVAYHGHGFEVEDSSDGKQGRTVSAPQRDSDNAASSYLPDDADKYLRAGLRKFVPSVAERPWTRGRLCWYTETPTGDFIADYHQSVAGLFIATGGSGQ